MSGTLAYVTDGWEKGEEKQEYGEGSLRIFDVSDSTNPVLIGSVEVGFRARVVAVEGDRAYVGCAWEVGLVVVDVSDPAAPAVVGSSGEMNFQDLVVRDSIVYASTSQATWMIDVSNDLEPAVVGEIVTGGASGDLELVGSTLYVANSNATAIRSTSSTS